MSSNLFLLMYIFYVGIIFLGYRLVVRYIDKKKLQRKLDYAETLDNRSDGNV